MAPRKQSASSSTSVSNTDASARLNEVVANARAAWQAIGNAVSDYDKTVAPLESVVARRQAEFCTILLPVKSGKQWQLSGCKTWKDFICESFGAENYTAVNQWMTAMSVPEVAQRYAELGTLLATKAAQKLRQTKAPEALHKALKAAIATCDGSKTSRATVTKAIAAYPTNKRENGGAPAAIPTTLPKVIERLTARQETLEKLQEEIKALKTAKINLEKAAKGKGAAPAKADTLAADRAAYRKALSELVKDGVMTKEAADNKLEARYPLKSLRSPGK